MDRPERSLVRKAARPVAAGALMFAIAASAAACGSGAQMTPPGNTGVTPSPSVEQSPSPTPSATATLVVAPLASPIATPVATLKPVAQIISPDPSNQPQSPVTAQEMEAAVTAYTAANPDGDLKAADIVNLNRSAQKCAGSDSSILRLTREAICQGMTLNLLNHAKANIDQVAWDAAFEVYWYTIGPNGLGPSVKADFNHYLEKYG